MLFMSPQGGILATLKEVDVDMDGFFAWLKFKVTSKASEEMFTLLCSPQLVSPCCRNLLCYF